MADLSASERPVSSETLLAHPDLWRAGRIEPSARAVSTGYPPLDGLLADRGWPKAGLIELLSPRIGIGELRLLGPALAALSVQERKGLPWVLYFHTGLTKLPVRISSIKRFRKNLDCRAHGQCRSS